MTAEVLSPSSSSTSLPAELEPVLLAAATAPVVPRSRSWWTAPVDRGVELRADVLRRMPTTGPGVREVRISGGAALFNMRLAVAVQGFRPVTALLPDPAQPGLLAVLRSGPPAQPTPDERALHDALAPPARQRSRLGARRVAPAVRHLLRRAAEVEGVWLRSIVHPTERGRLSALVPPEQRERAAAPGALLVLIGSHHDLPAGQLQAGQAMQRALLTARALGLTGSILAGPVDLRAARPAVAAPSERGLHPQVLLTVGHAAPLEDGARLRVASAG